MLTVRDHISRCRECRDEHYSLKTMKYLLSSLPEKEANPDWVAYLAESFQRPASPARNRWLAQWARSWDAVLAHLSPKVTAANGRRLVYALMVSSVAVFVIVAPFNHSAAPGPAPQQPASIEPSFSPTYASDQAASPRPLPPGEFELIPIPVPGPSLSPTAPVIMPTAPVIRPMASRYGGGNLTNVNMRVLSPAPSGLNGFGAPWSGPRFAVPPMGGH